MVTDGAMTSVSGVFIAPTIDLDKSAVKHGDPIAVFGKTAPRTPVTIVVHSDGELVEQVASEADGTYLRYVGTAPLAFGDHTAQAYAGTSAGLSPLGSTLGFTVGTENVPRAGSAVPAGGCRTADVNCDRHVDLVDYSVLAYWYQRAGTLPDGVDLNGDDVVTLTDFSILAYYWTG
jgi:hypothetical protein